MTTQASEAVKTGLALPANPSREAADSRSQSPLIAAGEHGDGG
jgi:hypothetical protein